MAEPMTEEMIAEAKRAIAVSDWPQEARFYAMNYVLEIQRLREELLNIYRIAALHFMGGAFDPGHMRDLAHMAAAARGELGEPDPDDDEIDPDDENAEGLPPYLRAEQTLNMPLTPDQVALIEAYPEKVLAAIERILGGGEPDDHEAPDGAAGSRS